ncbi:ABC transporter ATP-binding protein [Paracoccus sp. NSM]|uniref:ABC transporter ATP-binding protein n=1 Tax=Paracoccus sp. NSM TaxID=3457784 RepID=UPI0040360C7C
MTLECRNLTTGYDRRTGPRISDVTLSVRPGCLTALLGPNGCGKSTLLRALMGFQPAWQGQALLDGRPVASIPRRDMARRVAWLPQDSRCPDYLTVGELLDLGCHSRAGTLSGHPVLTGDEAARILSEVGLEGMGLAQVNRLSGGQRQRAFIAMVLAQDAEILLLDEPVNHLDIRYQYEIMALVRDLMIRRGRTVVVVLHDLNLAAGFADQVALMQDGRLAAEGSPGQILTEPRIAEVFGLRVERLDRDGRLAFLPALPMPTSDASLQGGA